MNAAGQRLTQQGWSQRVSTELIMGTSGIALNGLLRLCTGSGDDIKPPQRESERMRREHDGDAAAWCSPGEVIISDHVPRDGRVPGRSHLGREGIGRLALNAAQVAQTGVMAYVVVSQG